MNKRGLKVFLLLALGMLICLPGLAMGDMITVGDPFSVGSWAQGFNESGVGPFNAMQIFSITGAGFEANGMEGFSVGGWSVLTTNANYTSAMGPATTDMNFTIKFLGNSSDPLSFNFLAWNGATLKEWATATWNGGWSFAGHAVNEYTGSSPVVPIPPTALLLGSGLLGIVGLGWRRRKDS